MALGETVRERALSRVRVADDADLEDFRTAHRLAFARPFDLFELLFQVLDFPVDDSAVRFELGFAGTVHADAASAGLPRKVRPGVGEPRNEIFELGYFDHQAAFRRDRVLRENVEDDARSVENLDPREALFQVADLRTGKILVEDDETRGILFQGAFYF